MIWLLAILACAGGVDDTGPVDPGGMCTWVCDVESGTKYVEAEWGRTIGDQAACEDHAADVCETVWGATWIPDDRMPQGNCCADMCEPATKTSGPSDLGECEALGECWTWVLYDCVDY